MPQNGGNGSFNMEKVLITGGAGFIGSNLCEYFVEQGLQVTCLDNFSTGFRHNIQPLLGKPNFHLIEGDIRDLATCQAAAAGQDYILHQAALGSVPRSINDPLSSNEVNVGGFLNMLVAARDAGVKKFIYAASSSTYGDSRELPKIEERIGKPLSPYAVTKFVNELYAEVFSTTYGIDCIGLRYFNVFGRRQDPKGAYAAVIPKFVIQFMNYESPVINGSGDYSRDFTYIDNVIQMNEKALRSNSESPQSQVFNTAVGDRTTIREMAELLRDYLSAYDPRIADVSLTFGPVRAGDIPHSLASVDKAKEVLGYRPTHDLKEGLREAVKWYWGNLK